MDENRYLILLKEKDKTSQIRNLQTRSESVLINFVDSPKQYIYALRDVEILESRSVKDLADDQIVYQGDMPIAGVQRIVDFGRKVRLVSNGGASKIYDAHAIRVEKTGVTTPTGLGVIHYWADIAKYASVSDGSVRSDGYLLKHFDSLKQFVSEKSVLAAYLNHSPDSRMLLEPSNKLDTVFPFRFNLSQRDALNNALGSKISIIEGPPGTGKTQTILNILANLVLHDRTVAVVSSNNAAVQNVLDKLEAEGYGFLVAALGNLANRKRFFENPPHADVSDWVVEETQQEPLRKQLVQLNQQISHLMSVERERAQLQHELLAYRLEQEHFETFYRDNHVDETSVPSFFRPTPNRLLSFLKDIRLTGKDQKTPFLRRLSRFLCYGLISSKRAAQGTDVLLHVQLKYYQSKIEQLTRKVARLDEQLRRESFASLLSRHHEISMGLFRQRLHQKYRNKPGFSGSSVNYKRQFQQFVETYPIVLSTTHSLRNSVPENFLFDYVIIDESSQVDVVTAAL
jgi:hypothetical protein